MIVTYDVVKYGALMLPQEHPRVGQVACLDLRPKGIGIDQPLPGKRRLDAQLAHQVAMAEVVWDLSFCFTAWFRVDVAH